MDERRIVLGFAKMIPWDSYVGVKRTADGVFVDSDDVKVIRRLGLEAPATFTDLLATDAEARRYPQALMKVLLSITDVRVLQFALTLIEDFLSVDTANRAKYFYDPASPLAAFGGAGGAFSGGGGAAASSATSPTSASSSSPKVHFMPFLQLVGTPGSGAAISSLDANTYILERAAACSALLLSVDASDHHATASLLGWILGQLRSFGGGNVKQVKVTEVAAQALRIALRNSVVRALFVDGHGVEGLVPLLAARNTQLLYDVCFCLWALSLEAPYTVTLEKAGAVSAVARLTRVGMPVKVLRMALALMANVSRNPDCSDSIPDICESGVPETVEALLSQDPKITDPEMVDDLSFLRDAIKANKRTLTSLERYDKDLIAGRFEWTPVHSADFWKENALAFDADGAKRVKQVRDLLETATDEQTQAVALYDLGEFAVNHPQGRGILQALNVRDTAMRFLKSENEEVRQQALLAASKILVAKWQFVAGGTTATATAGASAGVVGGAAGGKR